MYVACHFDVLLTTCLTFHVLSRRFKFVNLIKMAKIAAVLNKFYNEYTNKTPKKLKLIDAYLLYILLTGIVQFVYCLLVGTFPFNSFLSGFISTVSCFILAGEKFIL